MGVEAENGAIPAATLTIPAAARRNAQQDQADGDGPDERSIPGRDQLDDAHGDADYAGGEEETRCPPVELFSVVSHVDSLVTAALVGRAGSASQGWSAGRARLSAVER